MPATEMKDIKYQELEALVRQYREERDEYETCKKQAEDLKKVADNTGKRLLAFLDEFKLDSQKTVYGTIVKNERWSWRTPKTPEDREAFREFLESKDEFNDVWSINSQTLNARAKEWLEEACEKGEIDFVIPGVGEPTCSKYLTLRRK